MARRSILALPASRIRFWRRTGFPAIDSAVTLTRSRVQYCVLLLNRDLAQSREATIVLRLCCRLLRYRRACPPRLYLPLVAAGK